MRRAHATLASGILLSAVLSPASLAVGPITTSQRVAAQRQIETVYWRHRMWPEQNPGAKPSLAAVLGDASIAARAADAVKKSNALELFWNRPLTAVQLDAEVARMARDSRDPEMLRELFAALDDDPRLIAECLARPALADAFVRRWYEADARLGLGRDGAKAPFESWWQRTSPTIAASLITEADPSTAKDAPTITAAACSPDSWSATRFLPDARAGHVAVWTGAEMLVWGAITYGDGSIPGGRYDPATDTWRPLSSIGHPDARTGMKAVWTGTQLIVWGGIGGHSGCCVQLESGGRYDPQTDAWRPMSIGPGVPASRGGHSLVWTGTAAIVWGGDVNGFGAVDDGARYDPATDSWTPIATAGAPAARSGHDAVFAGGKMVVWGGGLASGGRYDPTTDRWSPTTTTNAPQARSLDAAVSTGTKMIVWGGCAVGSGCFSPLNTGAIYDPAADTWSAISLSGAPAGRYHFTSIWTGSRAIVWGGCVNAECSTQFYDGGRLDPAANTWATVDVATSPSQRAGHTAVWTGSEMIVWGGCYGGECQLVLNSGGRYDPVSNTWVPTSLENAAGARVGHTAVWTGAEMIVWGGHDKLGQTSSGKRYDPATDRWTATDILTAALAREGHTAVWTGTEMIVWGGNVQGMGPNNGGGRYNPASDTWADVAFTGAPDPRHHHTAVWTGSRMIVWGGMADYFGSLPLNTGGRYDPVSDTWQPTTTAGAPAARWFYPAVWSGSEVLIWGGRLQSGAQDGTGARYDPVTDAWTPIAPAGAPSAREGHAAVWDGSRMIVWGGQNATSVLGDGARYAPAIDAWSPISDVQAPEARSGASAVFTGDRMVVWGGCADLACTTTRFTGGQYRPADDLWTATSSGAFTPFDRYGHTTVLSGSRMIVWGGEDAGGTWTNTGAAYCPGAGGAPVYTPAAPTALSATPLGASRIDLRWTDRSSNESAFKIERCRGALATDCSSNPYNFYWIGNVPAGTTAYTDATRAPGLTYSYRVRATNAGGDSGFTNAVEATTSSASPTPGEPSALAVTLYDKVTGKVTVSFAPACAATDHAAYSGPLSQVSTLSWDTAICQLGMTGTATFNPGAGSRFFVIVGQNGSSEGSFGIKSGGLQRPEASGFGSCDRPQSLANPCP